MLFGYFFSNFDQEFIDKTDKNFFIICFLKYFAKGLRMEPEILVFDNGSYMSKVGFAGDNSPRATFHSIVGTNQSDRNCPLIAGDNALTMLNISNPIQSGIITNWDEMEKVYISQ